MDDLAGKISEILNDPASMEKIKNLSNMLGIAPDSQDSSPTVRLLPHRLRTPTLWKPCWAAWAETDRAPAGWEH